MRTWYANVRLTMFVLAVATWLAACAPQPGTVTAENYEKLKFGMTYDAVVDILGKPYQVQPFMGVQQCTWVSGERHIHAKFIVGRAVYYSSKGLQPAQSPPAHKPAG
ncbi:MAG: hypothetical protein GY697_08920 [Desulfobacterales bacterium]|nr:hypothetical protein [Desulfobacterales bacterium]